MQKGILPAHPDDLALEIPSRLGRNCAERKSRFVLPATFTGRFMAHDYRVAIRNGNAISDWGTMFLQPAVTPSFAFFAASSSNSRNCSSVYKCANGFDAINSLNGASQSSPAASP
jgi:hypothetical protein